MEQEDLLKLENPTLETSAPTAATQSPIRWDPKDQTQIPPHRRAETPLGAMGRTMANIATVHGPAEVAASMVTGLPGFVAGGIGQGLEEVSPGLPKKIGLDKATEFLTSPAIAYQPHWQPGQELMQSISDAVGAARKAGPEVADWTREQTGSPAIAAILGTAVAGAPELAMLAGMAPRAVKGAKGFNAKLGERGYIGKEVSQEFNAATKLPNRPQGKGAMTTPTSPITEGGPPAKGPGWTKGVAKEGNLFQENMAKLSEVFDNPAQVVDNVAKATGKSSEAVAAEFAAKYAPKSVGSAADVKLGGFAGQRVAEQAKDIGMTKNLATWEVKFPSGEVIEVPAKSKYEAMQLAVKQAEAKGIKGHPTSTAPKQGQMVFGRKTVGAAEKASDLLPPEESLKRELEAQASKTSGNLPEVTGELVEIQGLPGKSWTIINRDPKTGGVTVAEVIDGKKTSNIREAKLGEFGPPKEEGALPPLERTEGGHDLFPTDDEARLEALKERMWWEGFGNEGEGGDVGAAAARHGNIAEMMLEKASPEEIAATEARWAAKTPLRDLTDMELKGLTRRNGVNRQQVLTFMDNNWARDPNIAKLNLDYMSTKEGWTPETIQAVNDAIVIARQGGDVGASMARPKEIANLAKEKASPKEIAATEAKWAKAPHRKGKALTANEKMQQTMQNRRRMYGEEHHLVPVGHGTPEMQAAQLDYYLRNPEYIMNPSGGAEHGEIMRKYPVKEHKDITKRQNEKVKILKEQNQPKPTTQSMAMTAVPLTPEAPSFLQPATPYVGSEGYKGAKGRQQAIKDMKHAMSLVEDYNLRAGSQVGPRGAERQYNKNMTSLKDMYEYYNTKGDKKAAKELKALMNDAINKRAKYGPEGDLPEYGNVQDEIIAEWVHDYARRLERETQDKMRAAGMSDNTIKGIIRYLAKTGRDPEFWKDYHGDQVFPKGKEINPEAGLKK